MLSNLPVLAGWLGAPLIMAGSAQLTAVEMLEAGAAPMMIIVLGSRDQRPDRHVQRRDGPLVPRRAATGVGLLLAIPLIDQLYLVNVARFEQCDLGRRERQAHWVGGALVLCGTWVASQTAAIVFGAGLPEGSGLGLAAPLALVGLLAMSVKERPAVAAAAVAGLVAVVGVGLPFQASILVAGVSGVVAGVYAGDSSSKEAS